VGESSCKLQGGDGGAGEAAGCLVAVVVVVIVSGCLGLRLGDYRCVRNLKLPTTGYEDHWFEVCLER
jgi:hypothetical protein